MNNAHETIEDRIAVLNDSGLLHLAHDLANRVSYYEAAEGESYRKEREERELAKTNFRKVVGAARQRGLEFSAAGKGYML
jgi:hypothetical protein